MISGLDWAVILGNILRLFIVIDPIGNIPIFITILKRIKKEERLSFMLKEMGICALMLLGVFFFGRTLIADVLHIPDYILYLSGGLILGIMGYKIIFGGTEAFVFTPNKEDTPVIFPISLPLTVGPGVIVMTMLISSEVSVLNGLFAIGFTWAITTCFAIFTVLGSHFIGENKGIIRGTDFIVGFLIIMSATSLAIEGIEKWQIHKAVLL